MLKLVIVGSRGHFSYVVNGLSKLNNVQLAGVSTGCGDSPDRLLQCCDQLCGLTPTVYDSYMEMLDRVRPDIVCVDGPFERHAEMTIAALQRGASVFCEKPMATTLDDLERVRAAWEHAGRPHLASMTVMRYRAPFAKAYELVQEGAIGTIKLIKAQKSYKLKTRREFYRKRATYGGTIPWVGSHALDWILWFSGAGFKTLYANHTTTDNKGHEELEIAAQVQCVMHNGILAYASMDYLRPDIAPTHGDDRIRLAGTDGVLEIVHKVVTLINAKGTSTFDCNDTPDRDGFGDFVRHVTGEVKALLNADQAFELTEACLLARESADRGIVIDRLEREH